MSTALTVVYSVILPILVFVLLWIKTNSKNTKRKLPPGPRGLPFIGNLHQIGRLNHRSLKKLSAGYGPLMYLHFGSLPVLIVSSAEAAREIFKTNDRAFAGRPDMFVAVVLTYGFSDVSFGAFGDEWRSLRKIMVTELLTPKRVQSFESVRAEEVQRLIDSVSSADKRSSPINLHELTVLLMNDLVCRVKFGKRCNEDNGRSQFHDLMRDIQDALGGFCVGDMVPRMRWFNKVNGFEAKVNKHFRELDKLYDDIIEEHKASTRTKDGTENEDVVDVMLRLQRDPKQEIAITNEHIKGVMTDTFNAGSDTGAATLVWTVTELMRHPADMKKARDEVRSVTGARSTVLERDLSSMSYLKAVIKESLRLHPPLPLLFPKACIEDCKIMGYDIPAGTTVFVNESAISRDPRIYESPEEFNPDRFLKGVSSIDFRGHDFELVPFGAGRRGCPGINFVVSAIELALANLLHIFDWNLPPGMTYEDIDVEERDGGLTTHKKNLLPLLPVLLPSSPEQSPSPPTIVGPLRPCRASGGCLVWLSENQNNEI